MTSKPPKSIGRKILKLLLFLIIAVPAVFTIFLAVQGSYSRAMKSPGHIQANNTVPLPDKPNWVSSKPETDKKHFIQPFDEFQPSMEQVIKAVESTGGTVVDKTGDGSMYWRITCEYGSSVFGFVDDLVIWNTIDGNGENPTIPPQVHFISSSRVGYSDLGANRQRVEKLKKAILDMMKQEN